MFMILPLRIERHLGIEYLLNIVLCMKACKVIQYANQSIDLKKQKRMERITRAIEYQLRCALLIDETVTVMECIPPSKIVSSLPLDDSLAWIGSHSVNWRRVKKGDEGFEMTIELL